MRFTLRCITLAPTCLIDLHSRASPLSARHTWGPGLACGCHRPSPRDWWQLFTDEAVFIIPVQGCTDQMDPDHPSTVRDTSVPVVAQSTNKSPAPWKAGVSHRGMDAATCCLLKTREEKDPQHKNYWSFVSFLRVSLLKFCSGASR